MGQFYALLVNNSLRSRTVPMEQKTSTIVPVKNLEKILETVLKNQLIPYIESNNIFIKEQSGFRAKHSCETALNLVLSQWKEDLNSKLNVVAVFIDLKRAFETIEREVMLKNLNILVWRTLNLNGSVVSCQIGINKRLQTHICQERQESNLACHRGRSQLPYFLMFILYYILRNNIVRNGRVFRTSRVN